VFIKEEGSRMKLLLVLKLLRFHQYIKNLFIFLPLFFALKITNIDLLLRAFVAFIAFSFTASAIYILNDYFDIEEDKKHPKKKYRPLASGEISKKEAIVIMVILFLFGIAIMSFVSFKALIVLLFYVFLNIGYSYYLKHVPIIDVSIIAIGFVLRLFVGAFVTNVYLSMWIVLMTFLLALFLALAKRRDDVLIFNKTGKKMRKVIDGYNIDFLNIAMAIMASVVIVAYIMYTTSKEVIEKFHNNYLYISSVFVILGILRYLQISFVYEDSGSPTKIVLKDRFVQLVILGWIMYFIWSLY
jgi:4-hydroxybenzoate polyprenyltransferase